MTTPVKTPREAKVKRLGDYDRLGRARWLIEWTDGGLAQSQVWFGTVGALTETLMRNGFDMPEVRR